MASQWRAGMRQLPGGITNTANLDSRLERQCGWLDFALVSLLASAHMDTIAPPPPGSLRIPARLSKFVFKETVRAENLGSNLTRCWLPPRIGVSGGKRKFVDNNPSLQ